MRGKPYISRCSRITGRLIPAYAGKTRSWEGWEDAAGAHPRVCGENCESKYLRIKGEGSSPRMRGKRNHRLANANRAGLIPAYAGKTVQGGNTGGLMRAHPRVCGENFLTLGLPDALAGSSPRMRGKRLARGFRGINRGLIPAYAGKTTNSPLQSLLLEAHPRVCGENRLRLLRAHGATGSSPRMRGKPLTQSNGDAASGLIPAYAGKTLMRRATVRRSPAHPRVCGENEAWIDIEVARRGSSPRMRGKLCAGVCLRSS